MKHILVTNDDGYDSAGYYPLVSELKKKYEITAIAPSEEKSWIGKGISGHNKVTYNKINHEGEDIFAIDGTPADCVQIGLYSLLDKRPDFIVSGINSGANTGHGRILSSGTIGAAMEGAIDGVVSIAVSLCDTAERSIDYRSADSYKYFEVPARIAARIIYGLEQVVLPEGIDVISINIPFGVKEDAEIVITVPHKQPYGKLFEQNEQGFKTNGIIERYQDLQDGTDLKAVYEGKVSVTPLDLSLANKKAVAFLEENLVPLIEE